MSEHCAFCGSLARDEQGNCAACGASVKLLHPYRKEKPVTKKRKAVRDGR
jgi:hypothetical protein